MVGPNKAHTATVNRIAKRYGGETGLPNGPDVLAAEMSIEVETHATLQRGIRQLKTYQGPVYLAVTNKEALVEAMRLTQGSAIGVMDPQGNILKACGSS